MIDKNTYKNLGDFSFFLLPNACALNSQKVTAKVNTDKKYALMFSKSIDFKIEEILYYFTIMTPIKNGDYVFLNLNDFPSDLQLIEQLDLLLNCKLIINDIEYNLMEKITCEYTFLKLRDSI